MDFVVKISQSRRPIGRVNVETFAQARRLMAAIDGTPDGYDTEPCVRIPSQDRVLLVPVDAVMAIADAVRDSIR